MRPFYRKLADFVLLQVGWFVCVIGAADGNQWIGPACVALFVAAHVLWIVEPKTRGIELRNVLAFGAAGCAIDAAQTQLGAMCFDDSSWRLLGLPTWLCALWFLFPILFNTAFEWLHGRPWLAATLALIGGPLSYSAGVELGALRLGSERWAALSSLGIAWAIYLPVAIGFARRDRWHRPHRTRPESA